MKLTRTGGFYVFPFRMLECTAFMIGEIMRIKQNPYSDVHVGSLRYSSPVEYYSDGI